MTTPEEFEAAARELERAGKNIQYAPPAYRMTEISNLLTQAAAMARDAERYRWLRDSESPANILVKMSRLPTWGGFKSGAETDKAIDAAMKEQK